MKFFSIAALLILLAPAMLVAQPNKNNKVVAVKPSKVKLSEADRKRLSNAKKEFRKGLILYHEVPANYQDAMKHFLLALRLDKKNAKINYYTGKTRLQLSQRETALAYFETALELNNHVADDIYYEMGFAHQLNENWDLALQHYDAFKDKVDALEFRDFSSSFLEKINFLEKRMAECREGKKLSENPVGAVISNLGTLLNSPNMEHSPIISANNDIMYLTVSKAQQSEKAKQRAQRKRASAKAKDRDRYEKKFESIYYATKNRQGIWQQPIPLNNQINAANNHQATVSLSPDGEHIIFYRGRPGGGKLFEATLEKNAWTAPKPLKAKINKKHTHSPSAAYSIDKQRLVFASDRKKRNYGRKEYSHKENRYSYDLFFVERKKNGRSWKKPRNIGATINTRFNERSVFFHADGKTMFFSSEGHNGIGGYDIFKTVYDEKTQRWSKPENLGYPVNTPKDDLHFVLSGDGRTAYYTSDRGDGSGLEDIYMISYADESRPAHFEDTAQKDIPEPLPDTTTEEVVHRSTLIRGNIRSAKDSMPLVASIQVTDKKTKEVYQLRSRHAGQFQLELAPDAAGKLVFEVRAEGHLFLTEDHVLPTARPDSINTFDFDFFLSKVEKGAKISLSHIYFEVNKAILKETSFEELDKLVQLIKDNPKIKIEIGGHTDNTGTESYNLRLSAARAHAVVDYLLEKGIKKNHLRYVGYGSSKPAASNKTEEGRIKNRRTEMKILKI